MSHSRADRESKAEYQRQRRTLSVALYFRSIGEKKAYKAMAAAAGYSNFNAWLCQMIANATQGRLYPEGYVEELQQEVERLRKQLEGARMTVEDYHAQTRDLLRQRDELLTILHGLPTGAHAAARFLQKNAERRAAFD